MINEIPVWLRSFRITVIDISDITLFDSWEDDIINDLRFDNQLGGEIGSNIVIHNKEYTIHGISIYSDLTTIESSEKLNQYGFQLTITVTQ